MDLSVARERLPYVVKPDSITASQGDFLATHVAVNRLKLLNKFEMVPSSEENYSEETVFQRYILNPNNQHQLIAVYGQSGTGKSHLIRWFKARFDQEKPDNEVVLFIRRSDNTLKGTIRQLLAQPEVQGIANKDAYERLSKATVAVDENKLKDMIYHNFIIEVRNDDESHAVHLPNVKRKRLEAFLNNDIVHDYLMSDDGPIERMYSKVAEHTMVDRDTVAQFTEKDFYVTSDLYEEMNRSGADNKAQRMALVLMSNDGKETAELIASYLNQFVNDVIQRCAGIEAGDFQQIFQDIRKELYRLGKNLTLFIEDVTSFTGVDDALLDALLVSHEGLNEEDRVCRISSIVGTTNSYLQNNFRDNHKDRITQYVYIPDNAFNEHELFEFLGRYLNTMSLTADSIEKWVENHAVPEEYPVHNVKEGKNWEFVETESGKKLCLYPFTPNSIRYFYRYNLKSGQRTPRYVIRDIIEPVVTDILNHPDTFPSLKYQVMNVNTTLNYRIHAQIHDDEQADRILRFLSIWGNGSPDQYTAEDGITYLAGIRRDIFEELKMPPLELTEVAAPIANVALEQKAKTNTKVATAVQDSEKQELSQTTYEEVSVKVQEKANNANAVLTKWINGASLDVSATVGISGILKKAHEDMCDFLLSAINWQAEGISMDNMSKIKSTKTNLLMFANQTKGTGFYTMPATWESMNIVMAFVRWREYGKSTWNYADGDLDAYLVTLWCAKIKDELVEAVKPQTQNKVPYIEAAITSEIYRMVLCGDFQDHTMRELSPKLLFQEKTAGIKNNHHSNEWNSLVSLLAQKGSDETNRDTVQQYFNIVQGESSASMTVLDEIGLSKTLSRVKKRKLKIEESAFEEKDVIRQRREVFEYLQTIQGHIDKVAAAELGKARKILEEIYELFGDDEIEETDIQDFVEATNKFFSTVNETQINVATIDTNPVKSSKKKIAKAIADINKIMDSEDTLAILMTFSSDPITTLMPLKELLVNLNTAMEKVDKNISLRKEKLGKDIVEVDTQNRYAQAASVIAVDIEMLSEMR